MCNDSSEGHASWSRNRLKEKVSMLFETHAHYDDEKFDSDRVELLSHLVEQNVNKGVNIGASITSSKKSIKLAEQYDYIYASIGVHPEEVQDMTENDIEWLTQNAVNKKVVAIGEIGLDYYWEKDEKNRERQIYWFKRQLKVAHLVDLPVVIHSRDACDDTLFTLREYTRCSVPGIIHCFSYSPEIARQYIDMGWYIGVGGVVTFKNGKKLVETVKNIPLEKIVIETDAPYMAPEPYRGQRNTSVYLNEVAEKIAQIKGITKEEVEEVTYNNALNIYSKVKVN